MTKHFEELWEEAENIQKDISDGTTSEKIVEELLAKLSVYRVIATNDKIPQEDRAKLKTHTFGKILAALTHLSMRDNVNTYSALKNAIDDLRIDQLESKYR